METLINIIQAASLFIAGASILANFTDTEADNEFLAKLSKWINLAALNFKK